MGRPILLQPAAVVMHIGRASTRRDGLFQKFSTANGLAAFEARWSAVLSAAAPEDAPPESLAPVEELNPSHPVIRVGGLDEVPDLATAAGGLRRAYALSTRYIAWLNEMVVESEEHVRAVDLRVLELADRIADLERRGPLALAKWKAGVWMSRHPKVRRRIGLG